MPKLIILPEIEVIDMYLSNLYTTKEICTFFKVSKPTIRKLLLKNNIKSKLSYKYEYYNDVFEVIDTEEKAYWFGFLYADGYVRKRKSCELRLKLSIIEKDHLLKFKKFISSDDIPVVYEETINKKIKNNSNYKKSKTFKISVNSNKIVNDLISKGCVSKKSKVIEFPNISENLLCHFIRGYFDGDGCVSYSNQTTVSMVSGSSIFLDSVSKELNRNSGCKTSNLVGRSENYKILKYSTKEDISLIYCYLYQNSNIFLDRKKIKFQYLIDNYEELIDKKNKYRRYLYKKNNQK